MIDKWFMLNLIIAHFVGDWWCQPRTMAMKKSEDFGVLLSHLSRVTLCLAIPVFTFVPHLWYMLFLNAFIHGCIDMNIWNSYKKDVSPIHEYWKDKRWYDTIATDQMMHLSTLALLFL